MRFKEKINSGIDPAYYEALAMIESSGNPKAKAKTSSAAGLFQFTKGTWNSLVDKMGLKYTEDDRLDPKKSREVVQKFTQENEKFLKGSLDRDVRPTELYLAHFLGMGGSRNLLKSYDKDPNLKVNEVLSDQQIRANRSVFLNEDGSHKSIKDVYKWASQKIGKYAPQLLEKKGYDYFNDPKKLFTEENKKQEFSNPKIKEAYESIDKRKEEFNFAQQVMQNNNIK